MRVALIGALDLAVHEHADAIAKHFALNDDSLKVKTQSISTLKTLSNGINTLKEIAKTDIYPSKHLAEFVLGDTLIKDVYVRISSIDDIGYLYINDENISEVKFGDEPSWIDITTKLIKGENKIVFKIFNGPYGKWSGRLQISAGKYQYDNTQERNSCPCNGITMDIAFKVLVDDHGAIQSLKTDGNHFYQPKADIPHHFRKNDINYALQLIFTKHIEPRNALH